MKTQEFLSLLESNKDKALLFEYQQGTLVGANYHITEIKHIQIDSVDCGARSDAWNETVIQLWESPSEIGKTEFMSAFKALGILKKVATIKPFDLSSEVKFEYGNSTFHTAQLFVNDFEISDNTVRIILGVYKTDCKAKDICGVPVTTEQVKTEQFSEAEAACCTPGSGCC